MTTNQQPKLNPREFVKEVFPEAYSVKNGTKWSVYIPDKEEALSRNQNSEGFAWLAAKVTVKSLVKEQLKEQ